MQQRRRPQPGVLAVVPRFARVLHLRAAIRIRRPRRRLRSRRHQRQARRRRRRRRQRGAAGAAGGDGAADARALRRVLQPSGDLLVARRRPSGSGGVWQRGTSRVGVDVSFSEPVGGKGGDDLSLDDLRCTSSTARRRQVRPRDGTHADRRGRQEYFIDLDLQAAPEGQPVDPDCAGWQDGKPCHFNRRTCRVWVDVRSDKVHDFSGDADCSAALRRRTDWWSDNLMTLPDLRPPSLPSLVVNRDNSISVMWSEQVALTAGAAAFGVTAYAGTASLTSGPRGYDDLPGARLGPRRRAQRRRADLRTAERRRRPRPRGERCGGAAAPENLPPALCESWGDPHFTTFGKGGSTSWASAPSNCSTRPPTPSESTSSSARGPRGRRRVVERRRRDAVRRRHRRRHPLLGRRHPWPRRLAARHQQDLHRRGARPQEHLSGGGRWPPVVHRLRG